MIPFARHLRPKIEASLLDTPAVLINGPRQSGKTTLVKQLIETTDQQLDYFTLDDSATLAGVRTDPQGFVQRLDRAIIDEVQRAPELLLAIKGSIDKDRRAGRFVLTGSANVMALPTIGDSLAGRIEVHTLLPLSNAEIHRKINNFLELAIEQAWPVSIGNTQTTRQELLDFEAQVLGGGYPEMLARSAFERKHAWARSYIKMLIERDIQDIANIEQASQIPRLLGIAAHHSGQLTNFTQIGGQLGLNEKTVAKYLDILEKIHLVKKIPAWHRSELKRLAKTPKLHFLDAGLQAYLSRVSPSSLSMDRTAYGQSLECWAFAELLKCIHSSDDDWLLTHYRDNEGYEVDFVLETLSNELIGIEVKASASVKADDFRSLRKLKLLSKGQMRCGIVLYSGQQALPFGEGMWAVPLRYM